MKTLVLFVFHEINKRVTQFIERCVYYNNNTHFLFICNNPTLEFNVPDYCSKLWRENLGWDFGGWAYGLFNNDNYKKYDYFIFVNSTVDGPYLPENTTKKWTEFYLEGLNNCELFGSTINGGGITSSKHLIHAHVQSYIFSLKKKTLEYIISTNKIFTLNYDETYKNKNERRKKQHAQGLEDKLSKLIIQNNWNIGCRMKIYENVDFTNKESHKNVKQYGDIMNRASKNKLWTPEELIFIKGNRC